MRSRLILRGTVVLLVVVVVVVVLIRTDDGGARAEDTLPHLELLERATDLERFLKIALLVGVDHLCGEMGGRR